MKQVAARKIPGPGNSPAAAKGNWSADDTCIKYLGFAEHKRSMGSAIRLMAGSSVGEMTGKRGPVLGQKLEIRETTADMDFAGHRIGRIFRKLFFVVTGQIGASALSGLALWTALLVSGLGGGWVYEALLTLALIRTGYFYTRGPKPVLTTRGVRRRAKRILIDETSVSIVLLAACFVLAWPVDPAPILIFFAGNLFLQLCLMSFSRLLINLLTESDTLGGQPVVASQQALIVGTGANARKVADMVLDSPELETRLIGFLDYRRNGHWRYRDVPLVGHPDSLKDIVANTQLDALFWAVDPRDVPHSWDVLDTAEQMGVGVYVMPSFYDPKVARVQASSIKGMPAIVYRTDPENRLALLIKNTVDRVGALTGIILAAPVMILVAIIVKLESKGPVFFRQVRSGLNGKRFTLYKFRTMCTDAECRKGELLSKNEMSGPVFKIKDDPRVTAIGRALRKFSIDEIPQFFNILKGDMSLVGPRPPLPHEVSRFEPWQHRKLSVKPGLTCLWQVNGRNNIDFEEWMRLDLQYIDNWSLWLDAKILAKTIPAVMRGSGR